MRTLRARLYDKIPGRLFLRLPNKWKNHILNVSGSVRIRPSDMYGHYHTTGDGDPIWYQDHYVLTEKGEHALFISREAD